MTSKSKTVVIKKYENRRLYDTVQSRYVNLDDIAALVKRGVEVKVVDARTKEDLTRATLMQIIAEDARGGPAALPLELLRQLIVASDHVGRDFIMWYLRSAFEAYEKVQGSFARGISEVQAAAASPVDTIRSLIRNAIPVQQPNGEVEELRRRVAELEAKLGERKPRRSPPPRRKASAKQR